MPFDFPDSPELDQVVVGPNNQLYRWDGFKWVHHQKPSRFVERAGDVMTGPLFLNDDGSQPLHAVTYRQLESSESTITENLNAPTDGQVYGRSGDQWIPIAPQGDMPPDDPHPGQIWFNPTDVQLYVFYQNHWVVAVNPPILPETEEESEPEPTEPEPTEPTEPEPTEPTEPTEPGP